MQYVSRCESLSTALSEISTLDYKVSSSEVHTPIGVRIKCKQARVSVSLLASGSKKLHAVSVQSEYTHLEVTRCLHK